MTRTKRIFVQPGKFSCWLAWLLRCLVCIGLAASSAAAVAAGPYSITNLSLGGNGGRVISRGINASGQVAGVAFTAGGQQHAFFYNGSTMLDLGTLGGGYSSAVSINTAGQVVGEAFNASGQRHAFSWTSSGGMVDLGTLGGNESFTFDVNDAGQVVGCARIASGQRHAFLWTPGGGMVDLGTLGGDFSAARGINAAGLVVGEATVASGELHAFSWTPGGGMVDLGTLGGGFSFARGVNSSGQAIGQSLTAGGGLHAFSWTAGSGLLDLGTFGGNDSNAFAVNTSGQVVGEARTASGGLHAFSWTPGGGTLDLGTLGGTFASAFSVNAAGQVVGYADNAGGARHAFLWTPGGSLVDLNSLIPTAPPGLELFEGQAISDNGAIVASGNTGLVLLGGPSSAPALGPIGADDPVAVGTPVTAGASFTDADAGDTHTALWSWGDGSAAEPGVVSESGGTGSVAGSHSFAAAGIYPATLTVTDSSGLQATVSRNVVVYDPSAGFVTGGGWIQSPPGAYPADPGLGGRATFGVVSRYQRGAKVPSGNTEFHFQAANLRFRSDSYDWLVVAGARAQYKGSGSIDAQGGYRFLLTAIDGAVQGVGVDRFRIRIWSHDDSTGSDTVLYDNQIDPGGEGGNTEGTVLGGGSIVIHSR